MLLEVVLVGSRRMISRSTGDQSGFLRGRKGLTTTRQHCTSGHWSIHRFNIADAELVAPRRRNHYRCPPVSPVLEVRDKHCLRAKSPRRTGHG